MTVRTRGGRFMLDVRHQLDGRVQRFRLAVPDNMQSRRGAQSYERQVLADLSRGIDPRAGKEEHGPKITRTAPTLAEFADEYIEACRGRGNKPTEIRSKTQILDQHLLPALGRRRLDEIDEPIIDRYRDGKIASGLAPKTVRNHLEVLRRALRIAHRRKLIVALPTIELPKRIKGDPNFLTFEEADRFLAEARDDWPSVFLFAMRTGLRLGEIKGLRWRDVDIDRKVVRVRQQRSDDGVISTPKSGHGRTVDLAWDVVEMLDARKQSSEYVFESVTDRGAWWAVTTTAKRAGITRHVHPHDLRHTFAAHAVMRGVDLITIKEWMGHHSVVMTEIYANVCGAHRAAQADRLAPPRPGLTVVGGHSLGTSVPTKSKKATQRAAVRP